MESGVYGDKIPNLQKDFNKQLYNNKIMRDPGKHYTPNGAGMLV